MTLQSSALSMDWEEEWPTRPKLQTDLSDVDTQLGKKQRKTSKRGKEVKKIKKKVDKIKFKQKKRKSKGKVKKGKQSGSFGFRSRFGYGSVHGEGSELDIFGLMERDRKLDTIYTKTNVEMAAKLLEKQSHLLELKRIEAEKLKEAEDKIDRKLLGEIAPPEEFWEKDDEKGDGKKLHSSHDRFMAFLKMLEKTFEGFDLEKYLPYIIFVDGVMYYKFYGTKTKFKENYSFN